MIVKVGFVGGTSTIDKAIQSISGGDYAGVTHAFIYLFDSVLEAEGIKHETDKYPGVWLHSPTFYDGNEHAKFINVDVPDMDGASNVARKLLGTPYSYHGCLEAAANLAGVDLPTDGELTVMCSETVTRILRAGGVEIPVDDNADMVTPIQLYEALKTIATTTE